MKPRAVPRAFISSFSTQNNHIRKITCGSNIINRGTKNHDTTILRGDIEDFWYVRGQEIRPKTDKPVHGIICLNWIVCACSVALPCLTLCDPVDRSPPGFSVHEILQARILEWVAISFSRGSCQHRDWTRISWIGRQVFYHCATWDASYTEFHRKMIMMQISSFVGVFKLQF